MCVRAMAEKRGWKTRSDKVDVGASHYLNLHHIMFRTKPQPKQTAFPEVLFLFRLYRLWQRVGHPSTLHPTESSNRSHRTPTSLLAARCISSESRAACWEALAYALFLSTYRRLRSGRGVVRDRGYGVKTWRRPLV